MAYRSNSMSLRAMTVSTPINRASGATAAAAKVFSATRRSTSDTTSAAPSVPRGINSRATVARLINPGVTGSIVPPQRWDAKSLPGVIHTRVPSAGAISSATADAVMTWLGTSRWVMASVTVPPVNHGAAITSVAATGIHPIGAANLICRECAAHRSAPAPQPIAKPMSATGAARGVDRSDIPISLLTSCSKNRPHGVQAPTDADPIANANPAMIVMPTGRR